MLIPFLLPLSPLPFLFVCCTHLFLTLVPSTHTLFLSSFLLFSLPFSLTLSPIFPPLPSSSSLPFSLFLHSLLLSGSTEESKAAAAAKGKDVVYSDLATKQMLVARPPMVLVLCLKRFIHQGKSMRKNNAFISFPLSLDLTPFCTQSCQVWCLQTSTTLSKTTMTPHKWFVVYKNTGEQKLCQISN